MYANITEFLQFYIFHLQKRGNNGYDQCPQVQKKGNILGIYWPLCCPIVLSLHPHLLPRTAPGLALSIAPHVVLGPPTN